MPHLLEVCHLEGSRPGCDERCVGRQQDGSARSGQNARPGQLPLKKESGFRNQRRRRRQAAPPRVAHPPHLRDPIRETMFRTRFIMEDQLHDRRSPSDLPPSGQDPPRHGLPREPHGVSPVSHAMERSRSLYLHTCRALWQSSPRGPANRRTYPAVAPRKSNIV
jgi:hypothetical protein